MRSVGKGFPERGADVNENGMVRHTRSGSSLYLASRSRASPGSSWMMCVGKHNATLRSPSHINMPTH
eukprot:scaffold1149_cov165-Amphora_coffeaeformis.AAC.10